MTDLPPRLDPIDERITQWMASTGVPLLRVSLGVVFFWFGALKLFPGLSPAEDLAAQTIELVSGGLVGGRPALMILGLWECAIGLGLIVGRWLRVTLALLFLQMPGTVLPMFLFPELTFMRFPLVLTIEGQYIIKNLVLVSAGLVIGATVRGGGMKASD